MQPEPEFTQNELNIGSLILTYPSWNLDLWSWALFRTVVVDLEPYRFIGELLSMENAEIGSIYRQSLPLEAAIDVKVFNNSDHVTVLNYALKSARKWSAVLSIPHYWTPQVLQAVKWIRITKKVKLSNYFMADSSWSLPFVWSGRKIFNVWQ